MASKRLSACFLVFVSALVMAVPAAAGGPEHFKFEANASDVFYCDTDGEYEVGPDEDGNGLPDWATGAEILLEGSYRIRVNVLVFFDSDGNPTHVNYQGVFDATITRPDTGETITEKQTWADKEEGDEYATNHTWHVKMPGESTAFHDAGRVIFNMTTEPWEVEFIAGHHPSLENGGPDYCAILGAGLWVAYAPL